MITAILGLIAINHGEIGRPGAKGAAFPGSLPKLCVTLLSFGELPLRPTLLFLVLFEIAADISL